MNARDTMALLGYAAMLDDTVDLRDDSSGMSGGDPVRALMNEVQRLEKEIIRLKIAHLRRMADSASIDAAWSRFCDGRRRSRDSMQRAWDRLKRFESACLAKITELKESP